MLLAQAIVQSFLSLAIIFLFKSMYINKYGVASTNRDDLSDVDGRSRMLTKEEQQLYKTPIDDDFKSVSENRKSRLTGGTITNNDESLFE
jgi:hypothetical protein